VEPPEAQSLSIPWTKEQAAQVEGAIEAWPIHSGQCERLAGEIVTVAKPLDGDAHRVRIEPIPGMGNFIVPAGEVEVMWDFHEYASVLEHAVDALTGSKGESEAQYRQARWLYPECLSFQRATDGANS